MRKGCQVILLVQLDMGAVSDACFGLVCFPLLLSRHVASVFNGRVFLKNERKFGIFSSRCRFKLARRRKEICEYGWGEGS